MPTLAQTLQTAWHAHQMGDLAQAERLYRQVLAANPQQADALHLLGVTMLQQGRYQEAIEWIEQAVEVDSARAVFFNHLGAAYGAIGQTDEAESSFKSALALQSDFAEVHLNLGLLLAGQCRLEEAVQSYREAVRLRSDMVLAHNNLGIALAQLGRQDEALAAYERALELQVDFPEAHVNRSYIWLSRGDFARGWQEYEWRWRSQSYAPPPHHARRWDGSDPVGKTLLLDAEQGIGDTIQFARYAQVLARRGARVILRCQALLVPLMGRAAGVERAIAKEDPLPEFDFVAPLMSLPLILGTSVESIPVEVPYLSADPALREKWKQEIASFQGFKVGVVWQGSRKFQADRLRSFPLAEIEPIAQLPGVRLFSLQKGAGSEQLALCHSLFAIKDLGPRLDETTAAFLDTAAVMTLLDLVITSDTASAHLAGALGLAAWVALPQAAEWRWLAARDDSPWYPTLRLFRQSQAGQWGDVFARMAEELRASGRLPVASGR